MKKQGPPAGLPYRASAATPIGRLSNDNPLEHALVLEHAEVESSPNTPTPLALINAGRR